jgi:hypothetical protein
VLFALAVHSQYGDCSAEMQAYQRQAQRDRCQHDLERWLDELDAIYVLSIGNMQDSSMTNVLICVHHKACMCRAEQYGQCPRSCETHVVLKSDKIDGLV